MTSNDRFTVDQFREENLPVPALRGTTTRASKTTTANKERITMLFPEQMDIPMPLPVIDQESEHYQKGRLDAANGHGFDLDYTQQFDEEDELIRDPEGRFDYDAGFRSWFPGEIVIA